MNSIGGVGALALMTPTEKAEALEAAMIRQLSNPALRSKGDELPPLPKRPTLVDFMRLRFNRNHHLLQSAARAMKLGYKEETVLACLLHDVSILGLISSDHGWWGAQLVEPYVSEKVSWAIRYHQACRFYPDPEVGFEYPEMYVRMFGENFEPEPYIKAAYKYARNHKWYMEARLITLNDEYSFDANADISVDPFVDIIGRHFNQPKEGLGFETTPPVAHMWRTIINPDRRL